MRSLRLPSSVGVAALLLAGCSGGNGPGRVDLAVVDLAVPTIDLAGPPSDLAMGPRPDLAQLLPGKRILDGSYTLVGVTSDGWVAVFDNDKMSLLVVKLTGGAPTVVSANAGVAQVDGRLVFSWHDTGNQDNGPLAIWGAASGVKEVAKLSSPNSSAAAADGSYVAFVDKLDALEEVGDIELAKGDGSGVVTVASQKLVLDPCIAGLDFTAAPPRLVAAHCPRPGDAGVTSATVAIHDVAGKPTELAKGAADYFRLDPKGMAVAVASAMDVGSIVPIGGGMPLVANLVGFNDGEFLPDGSALVFVNQAGALSRVPTKGGMATVLAAKGASDFDGLSPDGKFALVHEGDGAGGYYDLALAGTVKAGALLPLSPKGDGAALGDPFSSDSSHALFFHAINELQSAYVGALDAQPVAGGGAKPLAAASHAVLAASAARVVFSDHYDDDADTADILTSDLTKAAAPALLVTGADLDFALSPDKRSLVYTFTDDGARSGLYVTALP